MVWPFLLFVNRLIIAESCPEKEDEGEERGDATCADQDAADDQ